MNEDAKKRALAILEKRDVSRKMLLDKLTEKGVSRPDAEEVADWLCSLGVVDDRRYAGLVVRHYAGKGYGERRIREELYRRGIDRELWDEALEELPAADEALEQLAASRLRGGEPTPEKLKKVAAALLRRGYSWEEIRPVLDRYRADREE